MTRRREFTERKLLKVYLDAADHQRITEAAKDSGLSVSEWVRNRCLTHAVQYSHASATATTLVVADSRSVARRVEEAVPVIPPRVAEAELESTKHDKSCQCQVCKFRRSVLGK